MSKGVSRIYDWANGDPPQGAEAKRRNRAIAKAACTSWGWWCSIWTTCWTTGPGRRSGMSRTNFMESGNDRNISKYAF